MRAVQIPRSGVKVYCLSSRMVKKRNSRLALSISCFQTGKKTKDWFANTLSVDYRIDYSLLN